MPGQNKSKVLHQNKFLALILLFVAFDVLCENYVAGSFSNQPPFRQFLLIGTLLILQILISPIQAGLSDYYGRKISLIISISFSLLSLIFVYVYDLGLVSFLPSLILFNLSKGVFGNTVPISWAAVGDIEGKDLRFSFAKATAAYAIGYLILIVLNKFFKDVNATLALIVAFTIILYLCIRYFNDIKDVKIDQIRYLRKPFWEFFAKEISYILKDVKNKTNQAIFLAWILWEISIYVILALYADFINYESSLVEILMMIGYLIGTYAIKFYSHIEDSKMIRFGYAVSVFSLIPYFVFSRFFSNTDGILAGCYFFHALGNAFLSPTMFSIISKRREAHERGKIYGLAESADTIAFLISVILITIYKYLKLDVNFLIFLSFITVLISWIPYRIYEKLTNENNEQNL